MRNNFDANLSHFSWRRLRKGSIWSISGWFWWTQGQRWLEMDGQRSHWSHLPSIWKSIYPSYTVRFPTESSETVTALKSSVAADKILRSNLEDHELKTVLPLRWPQRHHFILKADCNLLECRSQRWLFPALSCVGLCQWSWCQTARSGLVRIPILWTSWRGISSVHLWIPDAVCGETAAREHVKKSITWNEAAKGSNAVTLDITKDIWCHVVMTIWCSRSSETASVDPLDELTHVPPPTHTWSVKKLGLHHRK